MNDERQENDSNIVLITDLQDKKWLNDQIEASSMKISELENDLEAIRRDIRLADENDDTVEKKVGYENVLERLNAFISTNAVNNIKDDLYLFYGYYLRALVNYSISGFGLNDEIKEDIKMTFSFSEQHPTELEIIMPEDDIRNLNFLGSLLKNAEELKDANNRLSENIRAHSHAIHNNIFPQRLKIVEDELKKEKPDLILAVKKIRQAYWAEVLFKQDGILLSLRNSDDPAKLGSKIREESANAATKNVPSTTIENVLEKAAQNAIYRFLNDGHADAQRLLDHICKHRNLHQLQKEFDQDVLFNENVSWEKWMTQQKLPVSVEINEKIVKQFKMKDHGLLHALMFQNFSEFIFNALKYGDAEEETFLKIDIILANDTINFAFTNSSKLKKYYHVNGNLKSIKSDLEKINLKCANQQTLLVDNDNGKFRVSICLDKHLFISPVLNSIIGDLI